MLSLQDLKMSNVFKVTLLSSSIFLSVGCSETPPDVSSGTNPSDKAAAHAEKTAGIQWFPGTVNEAFQTAKTEGKPVLLYWGAEWCPPCAQLKATIFKQQDFIAKTGLFVPVYLDGDEPNAQEQGEKFGVRGYPTLIVFSPEGEEMTRIPGGLELDRYTKVLDLTLKDVRPVKSSFEAVLAGEAVQADDFRLLAYYSWGQDNQKVLPEEGVSEAFYSLYKACPEDLQDVKARLYLNYVYMRIAGLEEEEALPLEEQQSLLAELSTLLAIQELVNGNLDFFFYEVESVLGALKDVPADALQGEWLAAVQTQADNDKLPLMERLGPLNVELGLERFNNEGEVSAALKEKIKARLAWADASIKNTYERQSVVNMSWGILSDAGMEAEGEALLNDALSQSKTPYYFMVSIASLAQKAGRTDEAVEWLARAFREAEGPATRIQWGVIYLLGLVEMQPGNDEAIKMQTLAVLSELRSGGDYHQRNTRGMQRMSRSLLAWNESGEHSEVIASLQQTRDQKCEQLESGSPAQGNCQAFLQAEPLKS